MLHLMVSNEEQVSSTTPIMWCVDEADFGLVKQLQNPYLLLVIVNEASKTEVRYLVPFSAKMEYISFTKPGKHTIYAVVVVVGDKDPLAALRKAYLTEDKQPFDYKKRLINSDGVFQVDWVNHRISQTLGRVWDEDDNEIITEEKKQYLVVESTGLHVEVPEDIFCQEAGQVVVEMG